MAISKLTDSIINAKADTVYKVSGYSLQELLDEFFEKINNCIDVSNKALKFLEWLVNEGLPNEVQKELEKMYSDGRLEELINVTIFEKLNNKVETNKSNIELLNNEVNTNKENIELNKNNIETNKENIININTEITNLDNKINLNEFYTIVESGGSNEIIQAIEKSKLLQNKGVFVKKKDNPYSIDEEIILPSNFELISNGAEIVPTTSFSSKSGFMIRNESIDKPSYTGNYNILIEGLIINSNNTTVTGVALAHTSDCTIRNVTIKNTKEPIHAMDLPGNFNLTIENCIFNNNPLGGIQIDSCEPGSLPVVSNPKLLEDGTSCLNVTIKNNYFINSNKGAIHLHKKNHNVINIKENYFSNCSSCIIDDNNYQSSHKEVTIENNFFTGSDSSAIVFYAGHNNLKILNNNFKNVKNGIYLRPNLQNNNLYSHLLINGNAIDNVGNIIIDIENVNKGIIVNNILRNYGLNDEEKSVAIDIKNSHYINIANNEIFNQSSRIKRHGIQWYTGCDNIIISNNEIVAMENAIVGANNTPFISILFNTIRTCNKKGIVFESFANPSFNVKIVGNIINGCKENSIRTANLNGLVLSENDIGISELATTPSISLNTNENGVITSNNVSSNDIALSISSSSTTKVGNNIINGNRLKGGVSIEMLNGSENNIITSNIHNGTISAPGTGNVVVNNIKL